MVAGAILLGSAAPARAQATDAPRPAVFGRVGYGRFMDDEGSLGSGGSFGVGAMVPLWRSLGLQATVDRHRHERTTESGPIFEGREWLTAVRLTYSFMPDAAVRPFIGAGLGVLSSTRRSVFPTFVSGPTGPPVPGPPEIFEYDDTERIFSMAAGVDATLHRHLALVGDVSIDVSRPSALSSLRVNIGAGWRW
jgi:hypothetical protein